MLYGLLLDRMGLSMKNGWLDDENRVCIIYQISEIQEDLGYSKKKAIEFLGELEAFGLIEKKRRGLGLSNIIYVKSFMSGTSRGVENDTSGNPISILRKRILMEALVIVPLRSLKSRFLKEKSH